METELIHNTSGIIGAVHNGWQFAVFIVIALLAVFFLLRQDARLKAQTDRETEERVKHRDEQLLKHENRMDRAEQTISGIGRSFDSHKSEHEKRDGKFEKELTSMDNRLKVIEQNLIKKEEFSELQKTVYIIKEGVAVIKAVIKERSEKEGL